MIFPIIVTILSPFLPPFLIFFPFLSYSEPLTFPFFGKLACKAFGFFFFSIQKKLLNKNLRLVFKSFCHFVLLIQKKTSSFFFYWLDASESKEGPSPGTPTVLSLGSCLGWIWLLWTCPASPVQAASSFTTRLLSVFQRPSLSECFSHRTDAWELLVKEGE